MSKRRRKRSGKPTGGGGARHPNSLANLIPGRGQAGPGNLRHLTHGATSELLLRDVEAEVRELLDALAEAAPVKEADGTLPAADAVAVERAARALKRYRSVSGWLDLHGRLDDDGEVRPAAELELKCERELGAALDSLGMTPQSRSKLGLRLVSAATLAEDAEANREARERLDRRLEALEASPTPQHGDQGQDDSDPENDAAEDVAAENQPDQANGDHDDSRDPLNSRRMEVHRRSLSAPKGPGG
jgi:hypothetical protein